MRGVPAVVFPVDGPEASVPSRFITEDAPFTTALATCHAPVEAVIGTVVLVSPTTYHWFAVDDTLSLLKPAFSDISVPVAAPETRSAVALNEVSPVAGVKLADPARLIVPAVNCMHGRTPRQLKTKVGWLAAVGCVKV
jgi:hypothetical protein